QYEAIRRQMDRPDSRSGIGPKLRFHDGDEEHEPAEGSRLRLWRHVLRRPDLEAHQLNAALLIPRHSGLALRAPRNDIRRLIVLCGRDRRSCGIQPGEAEIISLSL